VVTLSGAGHSHLAVTPNGDKWDCELSIFNSTLIGTGIFQFDIVTSKLRGAVPSDNFKVAITNSCLIDVNMEILTYNIDELNWLFSGNSIIDGEFDVNQNTNNKVDLNENYWEPSADTVVIDQRDESLSLNLGDNPTKGEADYSDILVTPHPDTPVCSR
jgi:hypothetical protein